MFYHMGVNLLSKCVLARTLLGACVSTKGEWHVGVFVIV